MSLNVIIFKGNNLKEVVVKRFTVEKLFRDKIPAIVQRQGFALCQRTLTHDEFVEKLKLKLIEEAEETMSAESLTQIIEEMADVLEVLHALAKASGIPFQQIEDKRLLKRDERGGFDNCVYVQSVESDEDNPHITHFTSQPEKYPEIALS